ncbi:hypothetical protein BJX96DRAFT_148075 [Aspergillus floccosus]
MRPPRLQTPRSLRSSVGCNPWERDTSTTGQMRPRRFCMGLGTCLGHNLAKMEMALIVGRLLYDFDLSLPAGADGGAWEEQETYMQCG